MPSWAEGNELAHFLPNLVKLVLNDCPGLQYLPSLRKLCSLKWLEVFHLDDLEYIEGTGISQDNVGAAESETLILFLEQLKLENLGKLKGWLRDEMKEGQQHSSMTSFPFLSKLTLQQCPNFTCIITCPNVEELRLSAKLSEKLRIMIPTESRNPKLRIVRNVDARALKSIFPIEAFQCVQEMSIMCDEEMESLSEVEMVFHSCSSSLQHLIIKDCLKLKSVCGGLKHLTTLKSLELEKLPSLNIIQAQEQDFEGEEDEKPWRHLHQNLTLLALRDLPKLVNLPKGIRYLTRLETLDIKNCKELKSLREEEDDGMPWQCLQQNLRRLTLQNVPKLESLPKGMHYLRALKSLMIEDCSDSLRERCQENTGQDWPNIQHIPDFTIR